MKLKDLKVYQGEPLEEGGTSISAGVAPAVRHLFLQNDITDGMKVLDYGAGKTGRNAKWLRDRGVKVYTYDPYHGTDCDGWEGVSNKLPDDTFDVGLSCFVLNVVPDNVEDEILKNMHGLAKRNIHVTRNKDIFTSFKKALERKDPTVTEFFEKEFGGGDLSDDNIMDFAMHGSKTSRGFQRIPKLENKGYNIDKSTEGYKIYSK
jgi:hypothetical protein